MLRNIALLSLFFTITSGCQPNNPRTCITFIDNEYIERFKEFYGHEPPSPITNKLFKFESDLLEKFNLTVENNIQESYLDLIKYGLIDSLRNSSNNYPLERINSISFLGEIIFYSCTGKENNKNKQEINGLIFSKIQEYGIDKGLLLILLLNYEEDDFQKPQNRIQFIYALNLYLYKPDDIQVNQEKPFSP